jgi:hypothetical protein
MLSVPELAVAAGLGFAVFTVTMLLGCRFLTPVCDSTGGLALVVVGLVVSLLAASGCWIVALGLGLAGRRVSCRPCSRSSTKDATRM